VLAEVEDPRHHVDPDRDPHRRLAFYARHGALLLHRPYFQPLLRPGRKRVYGMLLIVVAAPEAMVGSAVRSAPVAGFLRAYFEESEAGTEGSAAGDEMMGRLWSV